MENLELVYWFFAEHEAKLRWIIMYLVQKELKFMAGKDLEWRSANLDNSVAADSLLQHYRLGFTRPMLEV